MSSSTDDTHNLKAPQNPAVPAAPQPQTVRFSSVNQEIEPVQSTASSAALPSERSNSDAELSSQAHDERVTLSQSLQGSQLQQRRMSNFGFEPVSLPASRVSLCLRTCTIFFMSTCLFECNGCTQLKPLMDSAERVITSITCI